MSSAQQSGLLLALMVAVAAGSPAQARVHGLTGNARFQQGDFLPFPLGFTAAPAGKVAAIPGATVMQHGIHSAGSPAKLVIDPFQLGFDEAPVNLGIVAIHPFFFQIHTNLTYMFPHDQVMFSAGGRTGASIVTFCGQPGSTVTVMGNPACAGGTMGTGLLRYTRTANQFGGPAQSLVGGSASLALRGNGGAMGAAPCAGFGCMVVFANATRPPTGALGAPFGFVATADPPLPGTSGFAPKATVTAMGVVVGIDPLPSQNGLADVGTSWGGPWTTGMVTASAPSHVPPQHFQLTGSDGRAPGTGAGALSLVAGGFSHRFIANASGADRGWLNLVIGAQTAHVPLMPLYGLAAIGVLFAVSGAYAVRRWGRG